MSLITERWMDNGSNNSLSTYLKISTIEFFVTGTAAFAVGGLALFNSFIISNGSTNIEIKSISLPCKRSNKVNDEYYARLYSVRINLRF